MIFRSWTSPFDYKVATPYMPNGRYDSVPIGDIFPESCGERKWWGWTTHHFGKKTSPIVKLTLVPCSKGGTCGVIHSIKGTLYGCVYWLLTDWWTAHYMVHVWQWTWPWHMWWTQESIRWKTWVLDNSLLKMKGSIWLPTNQLRMIYRCVWKWVGYYVG